MLVFKNCVEIIATCEMGEWLKQTFDVSSNPRLGSLRTNSDPNLEMTLT